MPRYNRSSSLMAIRDLGGWVFHDWWDDDGVCNQTPIEENEDFDVSAVIFYRGRINGKYVRKLRDSDLEHLLAFPNIKELILNDSMITDHGLEVIAQLTSLERVTVVRTRVTASGVESLRLSLPKCRVETD
jgi:hypothetical protein